MILDFTSFPVLNDNLNYMNPWDEDEDFPLPGDEVTQEQAVWFHGFILRSIDDSHPETTEDHEILKEIRKEVDEWLATHATPTA